MTEVEKACFHCGLPVPAGAPWAIVLDGKRAPFCCAGCDAVAHAIVEGGLADYYRHRQFPATRGAALLPEELKRLRAWDRPAVQRGVVRDDGAFREGALLVENLRCGACVWLAERQLARAPGVISAAVNFASRRVDVRWDPERTELSRILAALAEIGLVAHPFDPARSRAAIDREQKDRLLRWLISGALGMQVMMLSEALYAGGFFGIEPQFRQFFQWASLLLTTPVLVYSAHPFLASAWSDLKHRRVGMDVPVALGLWLAFVGSAWSTWSGRGEVYFDSIVMFVFLLLGARLLENAARRRALRDLELLERAVPALARRVRGDGTEELVPSAELVAGDLVRIRPGEALPADGLIESGLSTFDEALLTGESAPIERGPADRAMGGAINLESPVEVRVDAVGAATVVGSLARLVDQARGAKPAIARLADRVASRFSAAILLLTCVAAISWWYVDPERVLPVVIALLVVSCPCALALATPLALAAASGALAKRGLLVTRPQALESLSAAEIVVFDKTGTLTSGRPRLVAVLPRGDWARERVLAIAASLERGSEHPLARAISEAAASAGAPATEIRNHPGRGVEGLIDGRRYGLGSPAFASESLHAPVSVELLAGIPAGSTPVVLAREGEVVALLATEDTLRPGARELVASLRQAGKTVLMLSGDHPAAVTRIARELGGIDAEGSASPERKVARIRELAASGRAVAMIGDGINDAAALSAATVSIAMGSGAYMAATAADAVLVSSRPQDLAFAFDRATKTLRTIRLTLGQALLYNAIFLPLAAFGWMPPWVAALGMSASSALVVLAASRLRIDGRRRSEPEPGAAVRTALVPA